MLKKTLLLCLLFQSLYTLAQETDVDWFPVGARWEYQELLLGGTSPGCTIEVSRDTFIENKSCRIIAIIECAFNFPGDFEEIILYQEENKVYQYFDGQFLLLYDFTVSTGDTLNIGVPYDVFDGSPVHVYQEVVDSVGLVTVGAKEYRAYWTRNLSFDEAWSIGVLPTVERIGNVGFIVPEDELSEVTRGPLLFYSDSCTTMELAVEQCVPTSRFCPFDVEERCDTMTFTQDISPVEKVTKAYPIPAGAELHIELPPDVSINHLSIYSLSGKLVRRMNDIGSSNPVTLDISTLPDGIYIAHAPTRQNTYSFKFIVHH